MMLAPIIVFTYNRLEHLQHVIQALLKCEESAFSKLIIYSDGPKDEKDQESVKMVREYLYKIVGFKKIEIIEQEMNLGLANSIISGVTDQVNKYNKVIVLEDDLLVSPYFLKYMNDMLEMYENDEAVASIHGYVYPSSDLPKCPFFIRGADCWGWGTWKRAWDKFESDGSTLLKVIIDRKLKKKFNLDFSYPYSRMLQDQINGKNNSWAIRWNASVFVENMYTLYPPESFVSNMGFDCSGTNCHSSNQYEVKLIQKYTSFKKLEISESLQGYLAFKEYFIKINGGYFKYFIKRLVHNWI
ncbi:MAG: glycosyltransferase family 2 protein [Bacteriovoracaceae bacterium]|nr:glycosyltransferase family 2 protein [Bacteriovoracaceae bacterium]